LVHLGIVAEYGKSKPPPCVCKERRHKDGAPSRIEMEEGVGQPPNRIDLF
jgi:hypothetical protein